MKTSYKVDNGHVYTIVQVLPFLWKYRLGGNRRWKYSFNEDRVQQICEAAVHRAINDAKAQRYVQEYCAADIEAVQDMFDRLSGNHEVVFGDRIWNKRTGEISNAKEA